MKGCNSERFFRMYLLFLIDVGIFSNFLYSQYVYNWCYMRDIQKFTKIFWLLSQIFHCIHLKEINDLWQWHFFVRNQLNTCGSNIKYSLLSWFLNLLLRNFVHHYFKVHTRRWSCTETSFMCILKNKCFFINIEVC